MNKQKSTIRFIIFNESYWGRGLIYSQNILPLIKLKEAYKKKYSVEIVSYTSFLDLIRFKKQINEFKNELSNFNIKLVNLPIFLLRSRIFILRWYIFPFFILSTFPYLLWYSIFDIVFKKNSGILYHLRSYPSAFLYSILYFGGNTLIFDPRSDFILENISILSWGKNSITDKLWRRLENLILKYSSKIIFISEALRSDILSRNKIEIDEDKHIIFYNPIDFNHFNEAFKIVRDDKIINFLYTGSLANWNNIETYLSFFLEIKKFLNNSTLTIITNTKESKFSHCLNREEYKHILKDIYLYKNITYTELPNFYKKCSIGLQLMNKPDSRIGVKFVEYLAAGIIPLVNTNVRGAVEICNLNLGIIINSNFNIDFYSLSKEIQGKLMSDYKNHILLVKKFLDVNDSYNILDRIYS